MFIRIELGQFTPWIRFDFGWLYPVLGGQKLTCNMTHKNRKNLEISCFEGLDVLFGGGGGDLRLLT
jgi:hypothetical protein